MKNKLIIFIIFFLVFFVSGVTFSILGSSRIFAISPNYSSLTLNQKIIELTNRQRILNGLKPLKINQKLMDAAQWLSMDMATNNQLNHTDSLGRNFMDRILAFGYSNPSGLAENIINAYSAEAAMDWWMNSATHKNNLLGIYNEIGVGATGSSNFYGAQDFGNSDSLLYPFTINAEDYATDSINVTLYVGNSVTSSCNYTPKEVRFSNDNQSWSEWHTIIPNTGGLVPLSNQAEQFQWALNNNYGIKTVYAQLTNSCNEDIFSTSDTINFIAPTIEGSGIVYRFFNKKTGAHLYTISTAERDSVIQLTNEWTYEGEKFTVLTQPTSGVVPVYRFWNKINGAHLYTIDENEKSTIMNTLSQFVYEGVKFYVYPTQVANSKPIYRFWNKTNGAHLYTDSEAEKNTVMTLTNFQYEGIKFYVM